MSTDTNTTVQINWTTCPRCKNRRDTQCLMRNGALYEAIISGNMDNAMQAFSDQLPELENTLCQTVTTCFKGKILHMAYLATCNICGSVMEYVTEKSFAK